MKPTLFLLAAGMGSRYGGLKQLDGLGPNGETIMDYSIYDAIKAGFGKLVLLSVKILNKTSAIKSYPNTKVISRANWCSRNWMHFPKDLRVRPTVPNLGEPTMP